MKTLKEAQVAAANFRRPASESERASFRQALSEALDKRFGAGFLQEAEDFMSSEEAASC